MKIYTKTGDKGQTGLLGGDRVPKASARICAIGEVDELNSTIGVARSAGQDFSIDALLEQIQSWLFDLGAELAALPGSRFAQETIGAKHIEILEKSIDSQTAALPPLKEFILPGGSLVASYLHQARSVCRRAERAVLVLAEDSPVRPDVLAFLNRLSDWLFVCARTANAESDVSETKWRKSEEF